MGRLEHTSDQTLNDIIITTLYLLQNLLKFSDDMNLINSRVIGIHEGIELDTSVKYVYTCKDLKFCAFSLFPTSHLDFEIIGFDRTYIGGDVRIGKPLGMYDDVKKFPSKTYKCPCMYACPRCSCAQALNVHICCVG